MGGFTNTSRVGKRQMRLQQFNADEEFFNLDTPGLANWSTQLDRGKPVKEIGSAMELCADGDEISGFVESVEAGLWEANDKQPGAVRRLGTVYALDAVGDMAIGDMAVASTQVAVGGAHPASSSVGQNPAGRVKKAATPADVVIRWKVMEVYDSGADRVVLLMKL